MDIIKQPITKLLDFIDTRAIVRRFVLMFTLYMTWEVTHQAWIFASSSHFDGMGTAAVIAAILTPVSVLQGFAFNNYIKSK